MTRQQLISALQRASERLPDRNITLLQFKRATGISEGTWRGRHWARWNDFKRDAGLPTNDPVGNGYDDSVLLRLVPLLRRLRRFPTYAEINLERRRDPTFPGPRAFDRFGGKSEIVDRLMDLAKHDEALADVAEACKIADAKRAKSMEQAKTVPVKGYVYLLKVGRSYKVGRSTSPFRRIAQVGLLLPVETSLVHAIPTDDPSGIEAYWKNRFKPKRVSGEFFDLSLADLLAFKKRRHFM